MPYSKKRNPLHTKFYGAVAQSTRYRAEEPGWDPWGEKGSKTPPGGQQFGQDTTRTAYNINRAEAAAANREQLEKDLAYHKTRSQLKVPRTDTGPFQGELENEWSAPRVRRSETDLLKKGERAKGWRTTPNIYRVEPRDRKSVNSFVSEEMPPEHRQWFEDQLKRPDSVFNQNIDVTKARTGRYTSGQRRRMSIYTDALQQGASHQEAHERVRAAATRERVGRPTTTERARAVREGEARQVLGKPKPAGLEKKFQTLAPTAGEFRAGVDAQRIPSLDVMKKMWPGRPEQDLIRLQQTSAELISQELLANQKWAHETRRANLLGTAHRTIKENPDKVTIFTTNVGYPAISLPSDSLVGQYIIRSRKSALESHGVPKSQLRGQFPEAVRDAHIIDVGTGASLGLEGRQGVFNTSGYRIGKRASQGYGRPRPLGSSILYDSSTGRPLYDAQGNIRYSEGTTRKFDYKTPSLGVRVLIG